MGLGRTIKSALRGNSGNREDIPLKNLRSVSDGPTNPYPGNSAMRNQKGRSSARTPRMTNNRKAPNRAVAADWWNDTDAYGAWIAEQNWVDREWLAQDWVAQDWYHIREDPERVRRDWGVYVQERQKLRIMEWSSQVTGPPPPEIHPTYTDRPPQPDDVDAADKTEEASGVETEDAASPTTSPQPCRRYAEILKQNLKPPPPRTLRKTSERPAEARFLSQGTLRSRLGNDGVQ